MTARRAVSELVATEVAERRGSRGTYVRHRSASHVSTQTINLITSAYEGSNQAAFLQHGTSEAERFGFHANVVRLMAGHQDPAIRLLSRGECALVLLDEINPESALGLALRGASRQIVALYPDLTDLSITSIRTDLLETFGLAHDRLRAVGHRQIAVILQAAREVFTIPW